MSKFDVICPDHYPMKCNLSPADKDYLVTQEKYKAFFIFQYRNQDEWLQPTIERYFNERTWRLFNAGQESGFGTKFCNVCRYALASDFGVVSLTPLNHNVFQEIGLMQGLQKPLLYLLNPNYKCALPFDMDDKIYVEHNDSRSLEEGIDKKLPLLLEQLLPFSGFTTALRKNIESKLKLLSNEAIELLKTIILEGEFQFTRGELTDWMNQSKINSKCLSELEKQRFIISETRSGGTRTLMSKKFNEPYRKHLEELLFTRWQQ